MYQDMSHYKIRLHLNEEELTILHDALNFYAEQSDNGIKESVESLYDKVADLYIEENLDYEITDAAKAFIDQFGVDEMFDNPTKWEAFREVYNSKE